MDFVFFKSGNKIQLLGSKSIESYESYDSPCNKSLFVLSDERGWKFIHDEVWISHVRLLANLVYPNSPQQCGKLMDEVRALRKNGERAVSCVMPYRAYIGVSAKSIYQAAYHLMQYPTWDEFISWPPVAQGYYLNSHTRLL